MKRVGLFFMLKEFLYKKYLLICILIGMLSFSIDGIAGLALVRNFQDNFDPVDWVSTTPAPNGGSYYFSSGYRGWFVDAGQMIWVPPTAGGSVKESLTLAVDLPGSTSIALVSPFAMRLTDWSSIVTQAGLMPRIHKEKICLVQGETITLNLKFTRHYLLGGNVADPVKIFIYDGVNEQKIYEYSNWIKYAITGVVSESYAYGFNPDPYGHYLDFVAETATVTFNLPTGFYSVGFGASRNVIDRISFATDPAVVPKAGCK
jgi:hypothetical protein